jgi:putative N6-adenine-specific DNA methylase
MSVDVGNASDFEASPLQLRGVVKNALLEALAARGGNAEVDAESPEVVFVVRRAGPPEARHTVVGIDLGAGARHRRGARVAMGPAAMRETMAAQLIMLSRWDARTEPLVDPMAGSGTIPIEAAGLAVGAAIRKPKDLPFRHLPALHDLPVEAPNLFPGTTPRILALDIDVERIPAMVGNLRAAGLTGRSGSRSIVIADRDVAEVTPQYVYQMLPEAESMEPGVFVFNPPYGVRIGAEKGQKQLFALYNRMGRAFAKFRGWRAACFVANRGFVSAFGHEPVMTKPASNAELNGAFLTFRF